MDEELRQRLAADPKGFARSIRGNLLIGILLVAFALILLYFSFKVVGVSDGGVAVAVMAIFPLLLAIGAFDDVRWRSRALRAAGARPTPP
jgi:hypothetical protein